jgi:hypothetical protein
MNKSAQKSVSDTYSLPISGSELDKPGVRPGRCDQAKVQLSRNRQSEKVNYPIYGQYGIYSPDAYSMSNIDLLLFSLSPLSFVAFVILPAIFGLIF